MIQEAFAYFSYHMHSKHLLYHFLPLLPCFTCNRGRLLHFLGTLAPPSFLAELQLASFSQTVFVSGNPKVPLTVSEERIQLI